MCGVVSCCYWDSSLRYIGMNKMVINHLEKLFVTNDAATVIKELEVYIKLYMWLSCT